jgi:hypothetical protein
MNPPQALPSSISPALKFEVVHQNQTTWNLSVLSFKFSGNQINLELSHCMQVVAIQGRARTARMTLPHFTAETPMFMPVGTQGEVDGPSH